MYQALYRKYRPLVFEDVIGQEHVVGTVKNQITNNKISHAYMFTGTRGTGKTTCAKILARAVNCENPVNGNPCNECNTCKGILNGSLLDVFEIDAASNNGVDNIRELREDVIFTPALAKYKVYIIDEVHMLSTQAFNALLKTLEEPPEHIIFIFATTEIHKVPQTILSRCQRFDFKRITTDDICRRLDFVAKQEGFTIEESACKLIARLADGAMRDALSVLDRCVDGASEVTLAKVESTVGISAYEEILQLLNCIKCADTDGVLKFYSECRKKSKDSLLLFTEICTYMRDMIVIKLTNQPLDLLSYDGEKFEAIKQLANEFTIEFLIRSINVLQNAIYDISKFKDKHIAAEIALIKLTNVSVGIDLDSINARLAALETNGVATNKNVINKSKSPESQEIINKENDEKINRISAKSDSDDNFWSLIMDQLSSSGGRALVAFLKNIDHHIIDGQIKIKCSKNDFAYTVLSMNQNIELIKNAAKTLTGNDFSVVFTENEIIKKVANDNLSELLDNSKDILSEE